MLTSLPTELLHKICLSLVSWRKADDLHLRTIFDVFQMMATITNTTVANREDSPLGNLRLVCRDIDAVVAPIIFKEVVLDFYADVNRRPDASLAAHLQRVVSGNSPLCHYTTTLRILHLCPTQTTSHNGERRVRESLVEEYLEQYVAPAISCMNKLRCIRVEKLSASDMKYFPSLIPHLSTLPLESLSMNFTHLVNWNTTLPIPTAATYAELKLVLSTSMAKSSTSISQIRDIVLANPHLTELDVLTSYQIVEPYCEELLLPSVATSSLKALKNLSIMHKFLPQDAVVIKHLHSLTSLRLCGMNSNLPSIWENLEHSGIWLEEIQVDSFSRALLRYIGSFSGLKKLTITDTSPKPYHALTGTPALEEDAQRFFNEALGMHRATLMKVCVEVTHWRAFCFCREFADVLALCANLEECSLTLDYDQGVEQALEFVMSSIATFSGKLQALTLTSAATTQKFDIVITAHWQLKRKQANAAVRWLRAFQIRDLRQYPQKIYLPQIDEMPVMTRYGDRYGVFKYAK